MYSESKSIIRNMMGLALAGLMVSWALFISPAWAQTYVSGKVFTSDGMVVASGAVALYHAAGVTPEASTVSTDGLERIRVEQGELDELAAGLDAGETPDLVVTGCPHASLEEVASVAEQVRGRTLRVPVWICTSRVIKERAEGKGYLADIEAAGGRIVADTCMVVSPLEEMDYGVTSVDSGKAANYLPGFCQQKVNFRDLHDIIEEVLE